TGTGNVARTLADRRRCDRGRPVAAALGDDPGRHLHCGGEPLGAEGRMAAGHPAAYRAYRPRDRPTPGARRHLGASLRLKPGADSLAPYDHVVVGAGSAGCVLASRLASAGRRVLVLEAGGSDRRWWIRVPLGYGRTYFDPRVNWCYTSAPSPELGDRASYWPRGKVVGGSSSINAMVYYRGQPHDFDDWARAAGESWSWPAVRGAFEAIERCALADGTVSGDGALWITDPGAAYHPLGER